MEEGQERASCGSASCGSAVRESFVRECVREAAGELRESHGELRGELPLVFSPSPHTHPPRYSRCHVPPRCRPRRAGKVGERDAAGRRGLVGSGAAASAISSSAPHFYFVNEALNACFMLAVRGFVPFPTSSSDEGSRGCLAVPPG